MRATVFAALLLGACTPEIVTGAYLCGPEQACPDGQVCSPATALCVGPGAVRPFACGDAQTEIEPNNSASAPQVIPGTTCGTTIGEISGCTPAGDAWDWYAFTIPPTCTSQVVRVRLSSSIAFQTLGVTLSGPSGTFEATAAACDSSFPDDGEVQVCLAQPVTAGTYTVQVAPVEGGNCDGDCPYNRYRLAMQLGTN